jgi:DNA-binding MarR family transcriptional regulator
MDRNIRHAITNYLAATLGIEPQFRDWPGINALPHLLRAAYDFSQMTLLNQTFLLFLKTGEDALSPATIAKHLAWLAEKTGFRGVFGALSLESFARKRLIEHKIPFIVPGNQLYLPDLGIDLREHFRKQKAKTDVLSVPAQAVLLARLLRRPPVKDWTATSLAGCLNTTKMSMSRAIEDLEAKGLIQIWPRGRQKPIEFTAQGRTLWEKALPALASPVYKRVRLENEKLPGLILAGTSALSTLSMIGADARQVYAISRAGWERLRPTVTVVPVPEAPVELEIWRYDPALFSANRTVDPLSLVVSLADEKDERIEQALRQILEEFPW